MKKICLVLSCLCCFQNPINSMLKMPPKQTLCPFRKQIVAADYFEKGTKHLQFKSPEEGYVRGLELQTVANNLEYMHDVLLEHNKRYPARANKLYLEEKWSFTKREEAYYSLVCKQLKDLAKNYIGAALNGWPSDRLVFIFAHAKTEYANVLEQSDLLKNAKEVPVYRVLALLKCFEDITARSQKPTDATVRGCYMLQVELLKATLLTIKKQSGGTLDISGINAQLEKAYTALRSPAVEYLTADLYLTAAYNKSTNILLTINADTKCLYGRYYDLLKKLRKNILFEIIGKGRFNEVPQELAKIREKAANALRSLVIKIATNRFSAIKNQLVTTEQSDRAKLLAFVQEIQELESVFKLPSLVFSGCPKDGMPWCWDKDKSYGKLYEIRKTIDAYITKQLFAQEFLTFTQAGDWHIRSFGKTLVLAEAYFKKLLSGKTGADIMVADAVECYLARDWLMRFHYFIANIYRPSEYSLLVKEQDWLFTLALEKHYTELITFFDNIIKNFVISSPEFRDALIKHAPKEIGWMSDIYKQAPDSILYMPVVDYLDSLMYILTMLNKKQEHKQQLDLIETIKLGEELQKKIEPV